MINRVSQVFAMPWYKVFIQLLGVGIILYLFVPLIYKGLTSVQESKPVDKLLFENGVVDVSRLDDSLRLTKEFEILEDVGSSLSIDELISSNENALFQPVTQEPNFGFTESTFWVKLQLKNSSSQHTSVLLRQDYPLIDFLDFWQIENQTIIKRINTGDGRNFDSREMKHKDFLFQVDIKPNTKQTVFLRYRTSGSLNIGLSLNTSNYLLTRFAQEQLAYGAYYGGVLVLAIYNMFLFFAAKEKAFTHYIWYLVSYGLYMSTHNGYAFQYLWPDNTWLANQSLLLLLASTLYWGMKFSQEIVATRIYAPRLDVFGHWLRYFSVAFFLASFVASYELMIQSLSILTVVVTSTIIAMGTVSLMAKYKPAVFFMIAWSTLLIAVLIYMLKTFGVLPHNAFTQNAFQMASLIEMTLLSVALSHHFSELKKKSYTDALTFLYNRRHFDDKFSEEFASARRDHKELSLLVMDIDHFKKFNDTYGHAEGDKVIQFVASVLKNNVRKPLIPCRYGGEEFAVILPRTPKDSALVLAERIRDKVATQSDRERPITISVGVANVHDVGANGEPLSSSIALFEAADDALYKAKENGRNCVEAYEIEA